jgi:hypothetical protein
MNNETTEEKIYRAQGQREADRIIHQLRMRELHEPQRKQAAAAQLEQDKAAFAEICRRNSLSECSANFHLWRESQSIEGLASLRGRFACIDDEHACNFRSLCG